MPIRKKLIRLYRGLSGRNQPAQTVQKSAVLEAAVNEPPITHQKSTEPTKKSEDPASSADTGAELILYGRPSCPYCARVDRVIEELDIEDKITRRLTNHGSEWRADLLNRTGSTQVPCLFINGEPMFESLDIIDWMRSHLS